MMSRDTGVMNPGLGRELRSDERLRAGRARRSHLSHEVDLVNSHGVVSHDTGREPWKS